MRERSERIFAAHGEPLEAIVLWNGASGFTDRTFWYVSGVRRGGYEGCAAVLRRGERPQLVVSALEEESARTAPDCEILAYRSLSAQREILRSLLGEPARLGVHARGLVLEKANALAELFPHAEIVDVSPAVIQARLIKDEREIECVREACRLANEVAEEIPRMLRRGMNERELAGAIDQAIHTRGGQPAFPTIVSFGTNGSEPHYSPGEAPLRRGELVLADFGARLRGYCSDITRMYAFGEVSEEARAMHAVVRAAGEAALAHLRPGAQARAAHRAASEVIEASQFAGRFLHGTGHSIGLDVHDGAGLNAASECVLAPGMVFTVEPGVYVPGHGGARIEDTVLVTEQGPEILTPATKELVEVPA